MDKVLDTDSLQFFHVGRSTGYDKYGTAIQSLEGRNSIFCIFIVTEHNTTMSALAAIAASIPASHCGETKVVNHLISGTSQEVARELSTCLTHSQVTDSQHKCFRTLTGSFRFETQRFKFTGSTVEIQCLNIFSQVS